MPRVSQRLSFSSPAGQGGLPTNGQRSHPGPSCWQTLWPGLACPSYGAALHSPFLRVCGEFRYLLASFGTHEQHGRFCLSLIF